MLAKGIESTNNETKRVHLVKLYETRWVKKQLSIIVLFCITKPCTEQLQKSACDLLKCFQSIIQISRYLAEFLYDDKQLDELHNKIDNSLSRIACRCYLTQLQTEKLRVVTQPTTTDAPSHRVIRRSSSLPMIAPPNVPLPKLTFEKKQDADYLLLIPVQIDLLLTVFLYKILTRRTFFETCRTYLTTYHNRPNRIVCWHKFTNYNISNSDINATLFDYCTNQTNTYINYEYNDVICVQYLFKLINIIDTITNVLAWHQAIVFIVIRSIVCAYWWQRKIPIIFLVSSYILAWTPYSIVAISQLLNIKFIFQRTALITLAAFIAKSSVILSPFVYLSVMNNRLFKRLLFK
ncbi:unnamed protein product [Adineta steineri]|uniref:Uncharacterized protein n=2 Tax=Adineta steineri TaxID=433720 RepID=A0A815QI25_9BILA|nr:unnamed protein product [Adineta steineri]